MHTIIVPRRITLSKMTLSRIAFTQMTEVRMTCIHMLSHTADFRTVVESFSDCSNTFILQTVILPFVIFTVFQLGVIT